MMPILATEELVVPTMVLLEVYEHVRRHQGRDQALSAIPRMRQGRVEDLDGRTALYAGELGVELGLPLADSVILATAQSYEATLWTQDSDFEGIDGVRFRRKKPGVRVIITRVRCCHLSPHSYRCAWFIRPKPACLLPGNGSRPPLLWVPQPRSPQVLRWRV